MVRKVCDKCGELLPMVSNVSNVKFPIIEIVERVSFGQSHNIDLCYSCTVKFMVWLTGGSGNNVSESV